MMKILSFALLAAAIASGAHRISSVENNGNWVYMYDDTGRKYKSLSYSSVGDVMGFSATFFVSRNGNWIYLFDSEGKKYKSLSYSSLGDVIGVAGDTFTSRKGGWIYTWDKNGKKIKSRYGK